MLFNNIAQDLIAGMPQVFFTVNSKQGFSEIFLVFLQ
jgi:hypothetical protein